MNLSLLWFQRICLYKFAKCSVPSKSKLPENFKLSCLHIIKEDIKEKQNQEDYTMACVTERNNEHSVLCAAASYRINSYSTHRSTKRSRKLILCSLCGSYFFFLNMRYMTISSEHYQSFKAIFIFRLFANVGCPSLKAKASLH